MVEGGDDVGRLHRLAVVELDALAQTNGPHLGVGGRLKALGELRNGRAGVVDLGEVVAIRTANGLHVGVGP